MKRYKIVYEDSWFIVVDKPSGMLVIPTPKGETDTLTDLLNRELDARGVEVNAYPCHRIDRETSGLIMYAKGKAVQRTMMDLFKARGVKKLYIAFAQGTIKEDTDVIKGYIASRPDGRKEMAISKYRVLDRKKGYTVLEVEPITGRKNQIRIQFKKLGHPLLGERIYAFRKDFALRFKRLALHAHSLEFIHPIVKKRLHIISPLPEELEKLRCLA